MIEGLIEKLAEAGETALNAVYGYGMSPKGSFGASANIGTATAVLALLEQGERNVEKLAAAAHIGWSLVATSFEDPIYVHKPEKKLQRMKLASTSYAELSEEEKEKDRVVARAILAKYQQA